MPQTVTIPLTKLAVGEHDFPASGGVAVADTDSAITLSVDRTVTQGGTQGFNGQPATTTAQITAWQSNDGGATWFLAVAGLIAGGLVPLAPPPDGPGGNTVTSDVVVPLYPGTGRQVRATVTVAGQAVAVAGTLTTS